MHQAHAPIGFSVCFADQWMSSITGHKASSDKKERKQRLSGDYLLQVTFLRHGEKKKEEKVKKGSERLRHIILFPLMARAALSSQVFGPRGHTVGGHGSTQRHSQIDF